MSHPGSIFVQESDRPRAQQQRRKKDKRKPAATAKNANNNGHDAPCAMTRGSTTRPLSTTFPPPADNDTTAVGATTSSIDVPTAPPSTSHSRRTHIPSAGEEDTRLENDKERKKMETPRPRARPQWLMLAIASGCFAALNGVFAKLYVSTHTLTLTSLNPLHLSQVHPPPSPPS